MKCIFLVLLQVCSWPFTSIYTQQQKKRENLLLLNRLKIKYVEFKKYIVHVKLTV